jgi:hypothetical protein
MRSRAYIAGRLTATLLVVFWAAQPVLAIAHAQAHAHRYCPEHQAFEDAPRGTGAGLETPGTDRGTVELRAPLFVEAHRPLHEECAVLTGSTREMVPGPGPSPIIMACLEVSHPATAPPRAFSSLAILDTAPKGSPPAHV